MYRDGLQDGYSIFGRKDGSEVHRRFMSEGQAHGLCEIEKNGKVTASIWSNGTEIVPG